VDSIFATYALMGPVFAVVRPVVAVVNGLLAGWLIDAVVPEAAKPSEEKSEEDKKGVSQAALESDRCADDPASGCGGETGAGGSRWVGALRYGLVTLPADIAGSLLVGLVVAALLTALVPADALAPYLGGGLLAMLAAVVVGTPLYVCATGSIPIGLGLLAAGASPGAVLAFLIAGPATNAATVSVTWNLLGRATGLLYLASVLLVAVGGGLLLDAFFPTTAALRLPDAALHPHEMALPWWKHLLAVAMLALLLPALVQRFLIRPGGNATDAPAPEATAQRQTLAVAGMTCTHCEDSVRRALVELPGVRSAQVSRLAKRAVVEGEGLDRGRLVEAVEGLGFQVDDGSPRPATV
jgi:copper chaperone CopZ